MRTKSDSWWLSGLAINLVSNVIAFLVGGAVTYFSHAGSSWVTPLLCGGVAWIITFSSILAIRLARRLPKKLEPVTLDSAGRKIRDWFDGFNLTVKSVHDDDCYFLFIVTTDGGKKVSVLRSKKVTTNHLIFKGLITATADEKKMISELSEDEKAAIRLRVQLELAHAVMGYTTANILEELTIFKSIPITETLTAEEVLNAIWEVEAALNSVILVTAMSVRRHNINQKVKDAANDTKIQKLNGGA